MLKFNIVTADEIWSTGRISFKFIFDSKMDYNNHAKVKNWGAIIRESDNSILVNVFNSDGIVFGWGNDTMDEDKWITELLKELPGCSLLMNKEDAEVFKKYCDQLKYEYTFLHVEGFLKTA